MNDSFNSEKDIENIKIIAGQIIIASRHPDNQIDSLSHIVDALLDIRRFFLKGEKTTYIREYIGELRTKFKDAEDQDLLLLAVYYLVFNGFIAASVCLEIWIEKLVFEKVTSK